MALCQTLKSCQRADDFQEIGIGEKVSVVFGHHLDNKTADTTAIEVVDIPMTVVTLGMQRKEQGFLRKAK